jgi:hypothetical protein
MYTMLVVLVLSVLMYVVGPSSSGKSGFSPDCTDRIQSADEDQTGGQYQGTASQGEFYETKSYTFTVEGDARNTDPQFEPGHSPEWNVTVEVGPWLKGSDQESLGNAWRQVSGSGDMPLVSGAYGMMSDIIRTGSEYDILLSLGRWECLASQEAVYIFGTVTFEDVTELSSTLPEGVTRPQHPAHYEIQELSLRLLAVPSEEEVDEFFGCYGQMCGYTDRQRESKLILVPYSPSGYESGPGPHPFVIAVPEAFASSSSPAEELPNRIFRLAGSHIDPSGDRENISLDIPTQFSW